MTINLILVDDHAMFLQGLAGLLEKEEGLKIVGKYTSAKEALRELPTRDASMILLDFDLGEEKALDFIAESRAQGFEGRFLIVTGRLSDQEAVQLVQAGVAGIVHKHQSIDVLCSVIRQTAAGDVYLERAYLAPLFRMADKTRGPKHSNLSERDKDILRLVFQGLTNHEIGSRLQMSESGAKWSIRQLFDKLGVRTRAQLVKVALEQYSDQL